MMEAEIWKPVVGYEGLYEVSNIGNVKSLFRHKKILKPSKEKTGYLTVELFKNKTGKRLLVHRLVAEAFIPNPDSLPIVNHKDETRDNNKSSNLEWCTHAYNMTYGTATERRKAHTDYSSPIYKEIALKNAIKSRRPVAMLDEKGSIKKTFISGKEAHLNTGINHSHILECCAGKRKTAGGFKWTYLERGNDLSAFQY